MPKLVSWLVLRILWCLEKRAMTGHSWGYGVLSNLRLHAQLGRFCVQMNNVTVLKARLRKTLGQNFSPKQSNSVIPWMSLIMMSIVQLEDARATWSLSCPVALWDYSRGIVAITRLRKKVGKKFSQNSPTVQFDETPTQTHTQPQNSIPFFSLVLQWFVVLILLVLANALWMRYRKTRRRIHRISSIRDAQRTPTRNVDDANR